MIVNSHSLRSSWLDAGTFCIVDKFGSLSFRANAFADNIRRNMFAPMAMFHDSNHRQRSRIFDFFSYSSDWDNSFHCQQPFGHRLASWCNGPVGIMVDLDSQE